MSAIKLIADNVVLDAIKNPCYVVYVPRLKLFLACPEAQAQGVAQRNGTTYWHLDGRDDFGVDGYTTVSAVSISDEEADALMKALDEGEQPVEPDPDPGEEPPTEPEEVLTLASVYAKVVATQENVDLLASAIEKGLNL
jgi:hypothetical protein